MACEVHRFRVEVQGLQWFTWWRASSVGVLWLPSLPALDHVSGLPRMTSTASGAVASLPCERTALQFLHLSFMGFASLTGGAGGARRTASSSLIHSRGDGDSSSSRAQHPRTRSSLPLLSSWAKGQKPRSKSKTQHTGGGQSLVRWSPRATSAMTTVSGLPRRTSTASGAVGRNGGGATFLPRLTSASSPPPPSPSPPPERMRR
jgi:hypothetical protein